MYFTSGQKKLFLHCYICYSLWWKYAQKKTPNSFGNTFLFICLFAGFGISNKPQRSPSITNLLFTLWCQVQSLFKKLNLKEIQSKKSKQAVSSMNGDCDSSTYSEKGKTDLYPSLWPAALLSYGSLITSKGTHHSPFMGEVAYSYSGTGSKQL